MIQKTFARSAAVAALALASTLALAQAPPAVITIHADQPVSAVSPTLFGLMTEELNYSYDGGLYAEMIRNRTFTPQTDQWRPVVDDGAKISWEQVKEGPSKALDHSLKVTIAAASASAAAGLANNGYW